MCDCSFSCARWRMLRRRPEHLFPGDDVHGATVVFRREQVAIAIHGKLKARMAGKNLHRFQIEPGRDPARDREVAPGVPVEPRGSGRMIKWVFFMKFGEPGEQRQEAALDHVVMAAVLAPPVRKTRSFPAVNFERSFHSFSALITSAPSRHRPHMPAAVFVDISSLPVTSTAFLS